MKDSHQSTKDIITDTASRFPIHEELRSSARFSMFSLNINTPRDIHIKMMINCRWVVFRLTLNNPFIYGLKIFWYLVETVEEKLILLYRSIHNLYLSLMDEEMYFLDKFMRYHFPFLTFSVTVWIGRHWWVSRTGTILYVLYIL